MQIPSDIYEYKLFNWAHHMPVENEVENAVKGVLCRLLYRNLLLLAEQDFSNEEKHVNVENLVVEMVRTRLSSDERLLATMHEVILSASKKTPISNFQSPISK